jgi:aminoglycoside phosphotransferase (APT) family kinase protein
MARNAELASLTEDTAMTEIGRRIGSGKEAEVFEYGNRVLKLYRSGVSKTSAFREAAHLALIERLALPAPRVHAVGDHDGRWGLVMDRAAGGALANEMMRSAEPRHIERMVQLHRRIHAEPGHGLPSLKARLSANIGRAGPLDAQSRDRLLRQLEILPDGDRVCHGDFHPWNIHVADGEFVVIDWLDACCGPAVADVCRTYILFHHALPAMASNYVEAYARMAGLTTADIFAWLPPVAAARLAEGVADEKDELLQLAGVNRASEQT